jgi:hypothetical protein
MHPAESDTLSHPRRIVPPIEADIHISVFGEDMFEIVHVVLLFPIPLHIFPRFPFGIDGLR